MGKKDKRVDAYIQKAAGFAKPILTHVRSLVHKACPGVEETIKWGFPHFVYNGIMASMASFKQHCSFGFWKASLLADPDKKLKEVGETSMGTFGRLTLLSDLPSDTILIKYIKEAARLNEEGVSVQRPARSAKKILSVPLYFKKALAKDSKASSTFNNLNYSQKKDYVEWLSEAKTVATRDRRLATALEWLANGKTRNWSYE